MPAGGPPAFGKGPRMGAVVCRKAVVLRFQTGVRRILPEHPHGSHSNASLKDPNPRGNTRSA